MDGGESEVPPEERKQPLDVRFELLHQRLAQMKAEAEHHQVEAAGRNLTEEVARSAAARSGASATC